MPDREDRLAAIAKLVHSARPRTQAELTRALRQRGFRLDQSTLSRDLTELGIRKAGGRYIVVEATGGPVAPGMASYAGVVERFTTCGPHLTVVTTVVGQAQPVAVAIDRAGEHAVAATLAGDDTIFIATKNRRTQAVVLRRLKQWFGEKHER